MKRPSSVLRHTLLATLALGAFASDGLRAQTQQQDGALPAFLQYQNDDVKRLIVKFRNDKQRGRDSRQRILDAAAASLRTRSAPVALDVRRNLAVGAALINASRPLDPSEADALVATLSSDPGVEYAVVDDKVYLASNDTHWNRQWWLHGAFGVKAERAWTFTRGEGIVVAVLDSGTMPHPDITPNRVPGYDFIGPVEYSFDGDGWDPDTTDADSCAHGLRVESTIAAVPGNGIGIAGVAPGATILPVRVISCLTGETSDIADAIVWASGGHVEGAPINRNPAEVINLSLAGWRPEGCSPVYQDAIDSAVARGTTVVAAAANTGIDVKNFQPANCDKVVAVGSLASTGARAAHSNHGPRVDLYAPGEAIYLPDGRGGYSAINGTSFAAPLVAGTIALMQSQAAHHRVMPPAEVEATLKATAGVTPWGLPMLDAAAAAQATQTETSLSREPLQLALGGNDVQCLQSVASGGHAMSAHCLSVGNQQMWWFRPLIGGTHAIVNRHANECLEADAATSWKVLQKNCHGGPSQRWHVVNHEQTAGGHVGQLRNAASGKCISLMHRLAIQLTCKHADTVWTMVDRSHRLPANVALSALQMVAAGGMCVAYDKNNQVVLSHECGSAEANGVRLESLDTWNAEFRIRTSDPDRCVAYYRDWNPGGGRLAVIRPCNDEASQQWTLVGHDGGWHLRNVAAGMCLWPDKGHTTAGNRMILFTCWTTPVMDNQLWNIRYL